MAGAADPWNQVNARIGPRFRLPSRQCGTVRATAPLTDGNGDTRRSVDAKADRLEPARKAGT